MALASPAFLKRVDKAAKEVDDDSMDELQSLMEGEARQMVGKRDSGKGPTGGRALPANLRSDAGSSQPSGAGGVTARQLKAKHFLRGRPKPQQEDQEWEPLADLLEVKQQAREAQGILETTALIPAELLCVQEALDAAREYSRRAALHKGQNLGHALVEIGLAFFQHIPETKELKDQKTLLEAVTNFWEQIVLKQSQVHIAKQLQTFKLAKPKKANGKILGGGFARLTLRSLAERLEVELFKSFETLGWEVKAGPPPRSANERRVRELRGFRLLLALMVQLCVTLNALLLKPCPVWMRLQPASLM